MPRYAFTLNPAPYKKWKQEDIKELLNDNNIDYVKIPKNYHNCDEEMQRDILNSVIAVLKKHVVEMGDLHFEETSLHNLHIHTWFIINENMVNELFNYCKAANEVFSSGKQHLACYIKEIDNIEGWQKYCRKMQWLKIVKQTYDFSDDAE